MALAGCSDPSWRNPALAHGPSTPVPEVLKIAAADGFRLPPPSPKTDHRTPESIPGPPPWAVSLFGQPLRSVFPLEGACMGNTDGLKFRYENGAGGARIVGWAWDPARKAAVQRVVLVDTAQIVRGAGDTGARRRDVPRAVPSITSETTGWEAVTPLNTGAFDAYGVLADGRTVCRLGHVDI